MKTDIVERLRSQSILGVWHPMMLEAAAEILRLRAENEKLRAALKPFAELADWYDTEPDTQPAWDSDYQPTVGQIRAARAAMGEGDDRL